MVLWGMAMGGLALVVIPGHSQIDSRGTPPDISNGDSDVYTFFFFLIAVIHFCMIMLFISIGVVGGVLGSL